MAEREGAFMNIYKKMPDGTFQFFYDWSFTYAIIHHRFEGPFKATHIFKGKPVQVYDDYRSRYVRWRYDPITLFGREGTTGGSMPKVHPDYQKLKPVKEVINA